VIGSSQIGGWFEAHAGALVLFARQWLPDRAAAEDVVQDVFVALMNQSRPPDHLRAWLFTAVRNAAISHVRGHHRRVGREVRVAGGRPDWFESRTEDLIDAADAQRALESLPGEQREVIVMRIWGQMTLNEISRVTGDAISTLFSRYQKGLSQIKQLMESSCQTKKDNSIR
jgi:RNA polymerase sigma-70 factor (ECF subfamily)